MPADIDPENEEIEPEERPHYIDTGPEARGEDEHVRYNIQEAAATEYRFAGRIAGWEARAPSRLEGQVNPTLELEAGQTYSVVWENVDGAPHDFVIQDADGNRIVGTEVYASQGETVTLSFQATEEMSRYICTVHPNSMVGDVQIAGEGPSPGGQQEPIQQPPGPGAAEGDVPELSVTTNMLREDRDRRDSWLSYDKGLGQRGYTPADRLDADNVASLEQKYTIPTDSAGMETNPVIVPSDPPVMYYTTSNLSIVAANARNGKKYWQFKYALPEDAVGQTGRNRGVAVWKDKVFFATTDSYLVALDRYTGEKEWETLMLTERQQQEMDRPERMSISQAPIAYDGRILVGMSGDFGGWCVASSVDAESGDVQWTVNMAPEDAWVGDSWRFASNAPWMNPSVDPETNTVFYSVGNPCPMMNGIVRPGPNKYSNSIVAVDIDSGEINWASQQIPHELWDYDSHATPTVFDLEVDGETRRAVSTDQKAGWTYVYDAETGRLLERTAPWTKQDHEWADHFLALPPRGEENAGTCWPGTIGATEWPPCAYDPDTGMRYVAAVEAAQRVSYDPDWEYETQGDITLAEGGSRLASEDTTHNAYVQAVDPASGDLAWRTELPDVNPEWSHWRIWPGGTTATGGGVLFVPSSGGHVYALDTETGERIWSAETDADRITPAPVVWDDPTEGTQYVAVAADDEITVWSSGGFEE
ncbi:MULTISPECIES: PQQ-binding-like beta-propeller repeat protein [Halorussus]|uniref:outer membrane protein assembly factor BamB family protein n=1 Tax=Halorussus TaxID=1070314 RepID=UPI000E211404|nr:MULTISPECIES: PQQ-binding-like beta-propeller repeat protein [Halorussus]NHN58382.1 PQQ-binding-like beta-propeller repeat protein [Halorussus sp. JP-T4]